MCKRDYNMDDSTVKFLIGHAQNSKIGKTFFIRGQWEEVAFVVLLSIDV